MKTQRGLFLGLLIVAALAAFEIFNYSTTDYALTNLLGDFRLNYKHSFRIGACHNILTCAGPTHLRKKTSKLHSNIELNI